MDVSYIEKMSIVSEQWEKVLGTNFHIRFYRLNSNEPVDPWIFYRYLPLWLDHGRKEDVVYHVGPFMRITVV